MRISKEEYANTEASFTKAPSVSDKLLKKKINDDQQVYELH